MKKRQVPELSLLSYAQGGEQDRIKFVDDFHEGLVEYGFIVLKDHTVAQEKIQKAYELVHEFFQLPYEVKAKYILEGQGGQRGFTAFGTEHAKDSDSIDLKEFWHVGREVAFGDNLKQYCPDNIWPSEVKEFKQTLIELYNSMDATAAIMLDALGTALDVPKDYFRKLITNGNSILRLINYPPTAGHIDQHKEAIRAAAHEDINLITMLVGATDSGLQLLDRDGTWLDVDSKPGEIVVDSGDMLSRITNDIIPSTTHRVINPEDTSSTRYSMPFFVHPHPEADLVCIPSCEGDGAKHPPINSHEFLLQRLRDIGLKV